MTSKLPVGFCALLILTLLAGLGLWTPLTVALAHGVAQEANPITLTARAGFDGYYKDGLWTPVRITLANDGPDVSGTLLVAAPRYSGGETNFTRPISLPSQSRKEVFIYISPEGYFGSLKVTFVDDRTELASTTTRLAQAGAGDLVYGVMAANQTPFNILSQVDPVNGQGFVAEIEPADLPPVGEGWQALDVLIISDTDTGVLTPEQRRAMAGWIAGGGRLIVTGGPGWQKTIAGLGDLLPALVSGTRTLPSLGVLNDYTHATTELDGPAIVAVAEPVAGADVALRSDDENGTPLIITKNVGYGFTAFLAFDPALEPFGRWDGPEGIYRNLLAASAARPAWAAGFRNWHSASEALNSIPGLELPSAIQLCGFLAVYVLAVGPINFFVLHRLKRRELAWVTIPALIFVFSGLAYLGGYRLRGSQATLHRLAVVQVWPNSDRAQVDMLVGVFSPRRTEYDLEIGGDSLARPLPSNTYGAATGDLQATLEQEEVTRIRNLRVEIGGVEAFVAQGHITAPAIDSTLHLKVQGGSASLEGQVSNNSELTLNDTVLLAPGGVERYGDFEPGQTLNINLPLTSGQAAPAAQTTTAVVLPAGAGANTLPGSSYSYYNGYDSTIDDILGSTYNYDDRLSYRKFSLLSALIDQYSGAGRGGGVYLVGWTEQAPLEAIITDSIFNPADASVYIIELRPQLVVTGGLISIPPGMMSWTVLDPGNQGTVTPYDLYVYQGHFSLRFAPSQPIDFQRVEALILHLTAYSETGPVNDLELSLWDFETNEWVALPDLKWGDNSVASPGRFVGPNGEIQVQVDNPSSVSSVGIEAIDFSLSVER